MFAIISKERPIESEDLVITLSVNISTGIYLFTIFGIASSFCGYSSNKKDDEF